MSVTTIVIPKAFYGDHVGRANEGGVIVKETKSLLTVEITEPAFDDLRSDARHYAQSGVGVYGIDFIGVIRSAQATWKRLNAYKDAGLVLHEATCPKPEVVWERKVFLGYYQERDGRWIKVETDGE